MKSLPLIAALLSIAVGAQALSKQVVSSGKETAPSMNITSPDNKYSWNRSKGTSDKPCVINMWRNGKQFHYTSTTNEAIVQKDDGLYSIQDPATLAKLDAFQGRIGKIVKEYVGDTQKLSAGWSKALNEAVKEQVRVSLDENSTLAQRQEAGKKVSEASRAMEISMKPMKNFPKGEIKALVHEMNATLDEAFAKGLAKKLE